MKRTKPNKPRPAECEAKGCRKPPATVLGGYWFCADHGNRDYETLKGFTQNANIKGDTMESTNEQRITYLEQQVAEMQEVILRMLKKGADE